MREQINAVRHLAWRQSNTAGDPDQELTMIVLELIRCSEGVSAHART